MHPKEAYRDTDRAQCAQESTKAQAQCGQAYSPDHVLRELFTYHSPRPDQLPKYEAVRTAAKYFVEIVLQNTPYSADQQAAIRKIREAVMTANAAIALDGLNL